jgi:dihydrofolate reductase
MFGKTTFSFKSIRNRRKIYLSRQTFVIGGATMYKLLMPYCKKMYITEINKDFDGDVWFPKIDLDTWKITNKEKGLTDENNPFEYEYVTYEKI